jgi:hypothetical protein
MEPLPPDESVKAAAEYLDPDRLLDRLTHIGFFLLAFELLRDFALENTRSFFANHWEFIDGKMKVRTTATYQEKVRSLAKHEFEAVIKWHVEMCAISSDDASDIMALLNYRNTVAHEPHRILRIPANSVSAFCRSCWARV